MIFALRGQVESPTVKETDRLLEGAATSPSTDARDDYALMQGVAERDSRALSALYDRHSGLVFSLCLRVIRDRADAEDLLIDIFWEVWEKCDRYDAARGSPVTYLVTLARSRAIDRVRSRVAAMRAGAARIDDTVPRASDASADPLRTSISSEQRQAVRSAMSELEPQQRESIEMSFFDGLSHSEIAAQLDRPLGTVKTWIRQGLIRLRDTLRETPTAREEAEAS